MFLSPFTVVCMVKSFAVQPNSENEAHEIFSHRLLTTLKFTMCFAYCTTILLYYNSTGIHWISWPFPFSPKFFSHCHHPHSLIFMILTNTTKRLVFHHCLSTRARNIESDKPKNKLNSICSVH